MLPCSTVTQQQKKADWSTLNMTDRRFRVKLNEISEEAKLKWGGRRKLEMLVVLPSHDFYPFAGFFFIFRVSHGYANDSGCAWRARRGGQR